MKIIDTADDVSRKLTFLQANGVTGIIRYDDPSGNPHSWKQVGWPEYQAILAAGLEAGIVSEWGNNHDSYFSAHRGKADAEYSMHRADQRKQPTTTAVHFAVDYDVIPTSLHRYVLPYFDAVRTAAKGRFRIGCYGSGYCCDTLMAHGLIDLRWITCSTGFEGSTDSVRDGRYELWQRYCDKWLLGLSVDYNVPGKSGDWGQQKPGGVHV